MKAVIIPNGRYASALDVVAGTLRLPLVKDAWQGLTVAGLQDMVTNIQAAIHHIQSRGD